MENAQTERPVERLIRIGEVKRLTGLSTANSLSQDLGKRVSTPGAVGRECMRLASIRGSGLDRLANRAARY